MGEQHVKKTHEKTIEETKEKAEILSWPFCVSLLSNPSLSTNGLEASADSLILAKVGQLPPTMITPSRKCSLFPHRTPIWPPQLWQSQACGGFSNRKNHSDFSHLWPQTRINPCFRLPANCGMFFLKIFFLNLLCRQLNRIRIRCKRLCCGP